MIVVGLQSGTSADAIDVAVADLALQDDEIRLRRLGHRHEPWPGELRERLLALLPPATTTVAEICALDALTGQAIAAAAARAVADFAGGRADLVVSHGQTVFHWVDGGRALGTLQLGQPAWIVEATGLPVVSDLRSRDVAAGGQGAPLASTLDALWLAGDSGRRAALNLGGIANVSLVAPGPTVVAFDTGPANCLLDIAAAQVSGGELTYDVDGTLALAGAVREDLLELLRGEPFFAMPAPKSTGRELFNSDYLDAALDKVPDVSGPDLLATLTALTAVTVADVLRAADVDEVVASGGGVRNPALMAALRRHLGAVRLVTSDKRGLPSDAKEAYLFALVGFLTWHGLPGVLPGPDGTPATGGHTARVLGRVSPGNSPLALPEPPRSIPRRLRLA